VTKRAKYLFYVIMTRVGVVQLNAEMQPTKQKTNLKTKEPWGAWS
jgi:hypothetical protein